MEIKESKSEEEQQYMSERSFRGYHDIAFQIDASLAWQLYPGARLASVLSLGLTSNALNFSTISLLNVTLYQCYTNAIPMLYLTCQSYQFKESVPPAALL